MGYFVNMCLWKIEVVIFVLQMVKKVFWGRKRKNANLFKVLSTAASRKNNTTPPLSVRVERWRVSASFPQIIKFGRRPPCFTG